MNTQPLRDAGIDVPVALECSHWHTSIMLVAAGLGVTVAPHSARRLELGGPAHVSRILMATRRGDDSPLVYAFHHGVRCHHNSCRRPPSDSALTCRVPAQALHSPGCLSANNNSASIGPLPRESQYRRRHGCRHRSLLTHRTPILASAGSGAVLWPTAMFRAVR
ncbi:LysR substrate-binding domain-containing protein [Streptomyces krungchingensis]